MRLTPSLGLTNSAVDLRLDSMASRAIPSRPQSVPRCNRTGHWHRNLRVLRISLWRLATQKRGLLLEALRSRWECPAGNAASTHGCGWSSLCTSMRTDALATFERVGFGSGRFCLIRLRGEISSRDLHRLFHLATVFRVANKTGHNAVECWPRRWRNIPITPIEGF